MDPLSGEDARLEERWRQYRRSLVEMWVVLAVWAIMGIWAITVSFAFGHREPLEELDYPFGLGIPDWAFWGIAVPWLISNIVTTVLCLWWIEDIPLTEPTGHAGASQSTAQHPGEVDP